MQTFKKQHQSQIVIFVIYLKGSYNIVFQQDKKYSS